MSPLSIAAQPRALTGKKVRRLRRAGVLPAVVYGPAIAAPRSIQIDRKEFEALYRSAGTTNLVDLALADGARAQVLIKDVQFNLLKRQIEHVDFYAADLLQETTVAVPVVLSGEAPIAARGEGVVDHVLTAVQVRALPTDIPNHVTVDLSRIETLDDDLRVRDLALPAGVTVVDNPDAMVIAVTRTAAQEAAAEEAVAAAAEEAAAVAAGAEVAEEAAPSTPPAKE